MKTGRRPFLRDDADLRLQRNHDRRILNMERGHIQVEVVVVPARKPKRKPIRGPTPALEVGLIGLGFDTLWTFTAPAVTVLGTVIGVPTDFDGNLRYHDQFLYWMGSNTSGVYRSTDGGFTGAEISQYGVNPAGTEDLESFDIAADGSVWALFKQTGSDHGVYKTDNGGVTWTLKLQLTVDSDGEGIACHKTDPNKVSVVEGTVPETLWATTDGGATWTSINFASTGADTGWALPFHTLRYIGDRILSIYVNNTNFVYRAYSDDDAATITDEIILNSDLSPPDYGWDTFFGFEVSQAGVVVAAGRRIIDNFASILRSIDFGNTFTEQVYVTGQVATVNIDFLNGFAFVGDDLYVLTSPVFAEIVPQIYKIADVNVMWVWTLVQSGDFPEAFEGEALVASS